MSHHNSTLLKNASYEQNQRSICVLALPGWAANLRSGLFASRFWRVVHPGYLDASPFLWRSFLSWFGHDALSWQKVPRSKALHNGTGPNPTAVAVREKFLGEISLNGYLLEAYEQEFDCREKQFRLRAFPGLDSEHEARYIRYLIHEGFIDQRWPRASGKIKEKAGWAFLL
jgi:hypothetical protein